MRFQISHGVNSNAPSSVSDRTISNCSIDEAVLADLGVAISEDGIARHEVTVQALVADARRSGIFSASLDALADTAAPEILRDRAFAPVSSNLVRRLTTAPVTPATPVTLAVHAEPGAQAVESALVGSTHAVSSPSTRFSRPNAIHEPRHMVSSTSSLSS